MLNPLFLLTPTGRTGTTLLMSILNTHKDIIIDDGYPYENRSLQSEIYTLQESSKAGESILDTLPYYQDVGSAQGKSGRYIAEKLLGLNVSPLLSHTPSAKMIALVRDPRDVLASVMAFDRRRGFHGFAVQHDDCDSTAVAKIGGAFAQLIRLLNDDMPIHLVRYEDLIADQRATLISLAAYLEVSPIPFGEPPPHFDHRTSENAELSIGRWRYDLSKEAQALFSEQWSCVLDYLDYSA